MKNLKIVLVVLLMFGGISITNAQRKVVKIYPKHGTVVTKIHKPKIIVHNRVNFRFADGVWYKPRGYKGIWYKKKGRGYVVVNV